MACKQRVSLRIYFFESRLLLAILYCTNHTNIAAFLLMSLKLGFPSVAYSSEQTERRTLTGFCFLKEKHSLDLCFMKFFFLFEVDLKVAAYAAPLKVPPDAVASLHHSTTRP